MKYILTSGTQMSDDRYVHLYTTSYSYACLYVIPWVFPFVCVLSCIHVRSRPLYLLCFSSGVKASGSMAWVSHLMPGDWWREGDLLVMSEEQAAGGKLFCPCLLRTSLLFFILLPFFFSPSTALSLSLFLFVSLLLCFIVALQCPFRSGCEVVL